MTIKHIFQCQNSQTKVSSFTYQKKKSLIFLKKNFSIVCKEELLPRKSSGMYLMTFIASQILGKYATSLLILETWINSVLILSSMITKSNKPRNQDYFQGACTLSVTSHRRCFILYFQYSWFTKIYWSEKTINWRTTSLSHPLSIRCTVISSTAII